MVLLDFALLAVGLALVYIYSQKTVEYATRIASALRVAPIIIGFLVISMGTDFPEIANSIFASYSGHGDINAGNALGSALAQITFIVSLVAILGGTIEAHRRNVIVLGAGAVIAAALALWALSDGDLGREDGLLLVLSYCLIMAACAKMSVREFGAELGSKLDDGGNSLPRTIVMLFVSLSLVILGAGLTVESAITISRGLGIPEFIISFFVISIGTSLPEFSVELAAVRKKKFGLAVGDLLGSNITDLTFAMGIGPVFFPTQVSQGLIIPLGLYLIVVTAVIAAIFAWKRRIGRLEAALLIGAYLLSFLIAR